MAAPAALRWTQLGSLALAFVALGLPMFTLHDCNGGEESFTGLQFAILKAPPLSFAPLALLGFAAWTLLRRQPDAPDSTQLFAAARYTASAFGGTLTFLLPELANLGGHTVWRFGGWLLLGGWTLAALTAGLDASWALPEEGPDLRPTLRHVSLGVRWGLIGGVALVAMAFAPFARIDPELGPNAPLQYVEALVPGLLLVVLPLFFVMRAFEARLRADRRGGMLLVWAGLVAAAVVVLAALVGALVDQVDRREAEQERAAAAAEEAAEAAEMQRTISGEE